MEKQKLFYVALWLLISLLITPKRIKSRYRLRLWVAGSIYVFFAATRDIAGTPGLDALNYYRIFLAANQPLSEYIFNSTVEPGYSLIAWIIYHLFHSNVAFLTLVYAFIYFSHVYFLQKIPSNRHGLFLSGVVTLNLFVAYYLQRNIIAVGFGLYVFLKLFNKEYKKALLYIFVAISFHYSAVILFPAFVSVLLFDKKKEIKIWKMIFFEIVTVVGVYFASSFLYNFFETSRKYSFYINTTGTIAVASDVCAIIILLLFFYKYKSMERKFVITNTLGILLLPFFLIIPLQLRYGVMYRMMYFFFPVMILLLCYLTEVTDNIVSFIGVNLFLVSYSLYRIISFFAEELIYIGLPYKSIIF